MTTDKPEVIVWAVRTLSDPKAQVGTSLSYPEWAEGDTDLSIVPLVSLSDYEALQAECEKLRKLLAETVEDRDEAEHSLGLDLVERIDAALREPMQKSDGDSLPHSLQ